MQPKDKVPASTPTNWVNHARSAQGVECIEAFFLGNAYGRHRHDTYAIGCTIAGVQAFHYRGCLQRSLPGQTMVLHPDEAHDGQAGTDDGFHYRMMYIDPALVQSALGGQTLPFIAGGIAQNPRLLAAVAALLAEQSGPADSLLQVDATLELALALQAAAGASPHRRAGDYQSAKLAREYLLASWRHGVRMADLEVVTGRDRWSMARDFRRFYGTSPSRFIQQRMLDAARQQLLAGGTLADVAADTGYADQAHMTRHFTQTLGIAPARWLRLGGGR